MLKSSTTNLMQACQHAAEPSPHRCPCVPLRCCSCCRAGSLDDAVQVLHCARQALQAGLEGARQLGIVGAEALLRNR